MTVHEGTATRVLVVGTGRLARQFAQLFSSVLPASRLAIAGRSFERAATLANLVSLGAEQAAGHLLPVDAYELDLSNEARAAAVVADAQPDIVVNCATALPYDSIRKLPPPCRDVLALGGPAVWIPLHAQPVLGLSAALRSAASTAVLVNCAYPDATNAMIQPLLETPVLGAGNVANNVPALQRAAAEILDVEAPRVSVECVMHHAVSHRIHQHGDAGRAPYRLAIALDGQPHGELDHSELFRLLATRFRRVEPAEGRMMAGSSAVGLVRALLSKGTSRTHVAGPLGLVGGYPAEVGRRSARYSSLYGLDLEESVAVNERAQRFDGLEGVLADGTIELTETARHAFSYLGIRITSIPVSDVGAIADNLALRVEAWGRVR